MKYEIEYEICLDEDFANRIGYADVEAESEKQAVEKFKKLGIFKAVIIDIRECKNDI